MTPPALNGYFYDLALVDVNALSCTASRLIYYGSAFGEFGLQGRRLDQTTPVEIDKLDAIRINLNHLATQPLDESYEYSLLYLSHEIFDKLLNGSRKAKIPPLKKYLEHIELSQRPSLKPKSNIVFGRYSKPVSLTKFNTFNAIDHCVPHSYKQAFFQKFRGYIARNKKENDLLAELLALHNLKVVTKRECADSYDGKVEVKGFAA